MIGQTGKQRQKVVALLADFPRIVAAIRGARPADRPRALLAYNTSVTEQLAGINIPKVLKGASKSQIESIERFRAEFRRLHWTVGIDAFPRRDAESFWALLPAYVATSATPGLNEQTRVMNPRLELNGAVQTLVNSDGDPASLVQGLWALSNTFTELGEPGTDLIVPYAASASTGFTDVTRKTFLALAALRGFVAQMTPEMFRPVGGDGDSLRVAFAQQSFLGATAGVRGALQGNGSSYQLVSLIPSLPPYTQTYATVMLDVMRATGRLPAG